jgi:hypothetical protein
MSDRRTTNTDCSATRRKFATRLYQMSQIKYQDVQYWVSGFSCKSYNLLLRSNYVEPRNEEDRDWLIEESNKLANACLGPLEESVTVYRGTCSKFTGLDSFEDKGLMSFTKNISVANNFAKFRAEENKSEPIIIQATVFNGLDVDRFYEVKYQDFEHNAQQEIIIPPSRFYVLSERIEESVRILTCSLEFLDE